MLAAGRGAQDPLQARATMRCQWACRVAPRPRRAWAAGRRRAASGAGSGCAGAPPGCQALEAELVEAEPVPVPTSASSSAPAQRAGPGPPSRQAVTDVPEIAAVATPQGGMAAAEEAGRLLQDGNLEHAAANLRLAIELEAEPGRALQSRVNLGCVLHRLGADDKARAVLLDGLHRLKALPRPKLGGAPAAAAPGQLKYLECAIHVNLSCCCQGQPSEQREHLERALAVDPASREALFYMASHLEQQGDPAAALPHLERALRGRAEDLSCQALLCRCLDRLGHRREALAACERLCRLDAASTYSALREVFHCRSSDVFVVTYPRCGTTWMVQVAVCLLHGASEDYDRHAVFVEGSLASDPRFIWTLEEELPSPRIMKMHAPADAFPGLARGSESNLQPGGKAIYVVRNPKDALVSLRHHHANNASIAWSGSWDDWVDQWLAGERSKEYGGSYFDHVKGWWHLSRQHPERILVVYFEDMKADLQGVVARVANFLGKKVLPTDLAQMVARCSFETMRAKYTVAEDVLNRINPVHFRRGEVGLWREVLTLAQARRVDDATRRHLGSEIAQGLRIYDLPSE